MSQDKTCVVTGGSGYLGVELVHWLRRAGWRAIPASRRPPPGGISYSLGGDLPPGALAEVDAIVHCAYDFEPSDWDSIYQTNVMGTQRLLEQAQKAGVKTFITISSISAFVGCRSLYGKAKLLMEAATLAAGGAVVRPGLIYGGRGGGMFQRLEVQARTKRIIPLLAGGRSTQYLVQIEDLCGVLEGILAARVPTPQTPQTIVHPQPWTLRQILTSLAGERKITFIPLPWQMAWLGLRLAEFCGWKLNFKSDSIVGIVYQNPHSDFSQTVFPVRPFAPSQNRKDHANI